MAVAFTVERYIDFRVEANELLREHGEELNKRPDRRIAKLDDNQYLYAEDIGALHVLVVREDGVMIGYFVSFIMPHKHYADTLCAFEDGYFLSQSHRKGLTGYRLFAEWKRMMKALGVQELYAMTKVDPAHDASILWERLGFEKTDWTLRMWIGD